ncbi:MAG: YdcF family protein [Actinobacteria bacterium]|nr:YdcF family protein [Actinomycetota bacterium]
MFGCLRIIRRAIVVFTLIGIAIAGIAVSHVMVTAHREDAQRTDAIVVLGAAQYAGRPTALLANRLDHARVLLRRGISQRIITVGGKRPGDVTTEAQAGVRYLRKRGVNRAALVPVPVGSDTWTSMQAVAQRCKMRGWSSITIVSDPAHLARAAAMAHRLGLTARVSGTVGGSGSKVTAAYVARESAGLMWFWAQRWLPDGVRSRLPA